MSFVGMASSSGLRKAPSLKRNSSETGTTPRDLGHQQNLGDAAAIGSPSPTQYQGGEAKVIPFDRTFFFGLRLGPVCAQQADTGEGRIGNNTWARKTFIGGLKTDRSPVQRMIGPLGRLPHELRRHHGGHEPQEREADAAVVPRSAAPPVVRFGSQHKEPGEPRAV